MMGIVACFKLGMLCVVLMTVVEASQADDAEVTSHYKDKLTKMKNLLENGHCKRVYFDLGSNVGVQIRKLYQPLHFRGAKVLPIFSKYFGHERKDICAFGFEPNSIHSATLENLEERYTAAGYPVVMFTRTAISNSSGIMKFYREPLPDPKKHEYGSSLFKSQDNMIEETAYVADFAQLLRDTFLKHPDAERRIVAKMDIEGAEYDVLPSLLADNLICLFDVVMMEYHPGKGFSREFPLAYKNKLQRMAGCATVMVQLDDETYNEGGGGVAFPSD